MMFGLLLNGPLAVTPIATPRGRYRFLTLVADNGLQGLPPVELRVALFRFGYGYGWDVRPVLLDGAKGPVEVTLDEHENIGAISIQRLNAGDVNVAWAVT